MLEVRDITHNHLCTALERVVGIVWKRKHCTVTSFMCRRDLKKHFGQKKYASLAHCLSYHTLLCRLEGRNVCFLCPIYSLVFTFKSQELLFSHTRASLLGYHFTHVLVAAIIPADQTILFKYSSSSLECITSMPAHISLKLLS